MPITRTTMIDDDGSGLTGTILNNAWLQTIYNQIDAVTGGPIVNWTPTDASGAGLVFAGAVGGYQVIGPLVIYFARLTYPATANTATAQITGLPFPSNPAYFTGAYPTYSSVPVVLHHPVSTTIIHLQTQIGGGNPNNALSGGQFIFQGFYWKA